jgi:tyrosinase
VALICDLPQAHSTHSQCCGLPHAGMFSSKKEDARYSLLADAENHDEPSDGIEKGDKPSWTSKQSYWSYLHRPILIPLLVLIISALSVTLVILSTATPKGCRHPRIRREWRTYSKAERQAYVDAAVCLTRTQSPTDSRVSIHDDFSYLHSRIGNYCKPEFLSSCIRH